MITEFELQSGRGTNVEIIGKEPDQLWLIIDEVKLVEMIRLAFDCPQFHIDHLVDAVSGTCEEGGEDAEFLAILHRDYPGYEFELGEAAR